MNLPKKSTLAQTPPMGWNSWNMFGSRVCEKAIIDTADTLVSSGMRDLGYNYIVIDDCWSKRKSRDSNGDLIPDPEKFPNGIKPLSDYVHSLGMKLGIYSDAADKTCGGYIGSLGFEEQDAKLWASWEIDFLKYDYCYAPEDQATAIERYRKMGEALRSTGREFLFSACEWGGRAPHLWGKDLGAHMWRVSGDVFDSWIDVWVTPHNYYGIGIDTSIDLAARLAPYGGPGGWNDLDMLIVGLKGKGQVHGGGISFIEYQTHMSLWCIACSPLMAGCDLTHIDKDTVSLLTNKEVIAVNQDPLGIPGHRVGQAGKCDLWKKPLSDGSLAVAIINRGSSGTDFTLKSADIGFLDSSKSVYNIWKGEEIAELKAKLDVRVQPHETIMLKITSV